LRNFSTESFSRYYAVTPPLDHRPSFRRANREQPLKASIAGLAAQIGSLSGDVRKLLRMPFTFVTNLLRFLGRAAQLQKMI
jgi:hypothetical protein